MNLKKLLLAVIVGIVMACAVPARHVSPPPFRDDYVHEPGWESVGRRLVGIASWYDSHSWYTGYSSWVIASRKGCAAHPEWHCYIKGGVGYVRPYRGSRHYAAPGPKLQELIRTMYPKWATYHRTPITATITNPKTGKSMEVILADTCWCWSGTKDTSDDKIIDLSPEVFRALGVPLSRGIQKVIVEIAP